MAKHMTIKDIAKQAGVSETTISRYLNKKYEYMSEKTRRKIEAVVKEMDYRPSNVARSLKSQKSKLIGAVIADIGNPFSSEIIKGLSDTCEKLGYTLMIAISDESAEKERLQIEKFIDNQVEGVIVNTSGNNQTYLEQLNHSSTPLVLLDRGVSTSQFDLVSNDNYASGRQAMSYLVTSGFRSIGFFVNPLTNTVRTERMRAFEDGLKAHSEVVGQAFVVESNDQETLSASLKAFQQMPAPRVIFTANGSTALAVLEALKADNYELIKDFGLLSFDELTWAKVISPGITTIDQSSYGLGEEACRQLIRKIEEPTVIKGKETRLPSELIIRESTSYLG